MTGNETNPEARNEVRAMLAESAERAFAELCTREAIHAAESGTWPQQLWNTLEELGFTRAAVAENHGGSGVALADALPMVRIAGRHAAPVPFGETLVAGWLLSIAGLEVPVGPLGFGPADRRGLVTLRRADRGTHDGSNKAWVLQGSLRNLPWGAQAQRIALVLPTEEGLMIASVDPALGRATAGSNLAGEPRSRIDFDGASLAADDVRPAPGFFVAGIGADAALLLGALLRGQQMAGALSAARDLAVRYTGERIAFGKPLNKLQAVQQNLAVLAGHAAAANVAADMALDAVAAAFNAFDAFHAFHATGPSDVGLPDLLSPIGLAKVRIGEAVEIGARLAHQAHGAIGFTYEHALHHATRRLWSWRDEFGNESYWAQRIGRRIVEAGADHLWTTVTKAAQL